MKTSVSNKTRKIQKKSTLLNEMIILIAQSKDMQVQKVGELFVSFLTQVLALLK